jgi:uncharacterized protein YukE
MAGDGYEVRPDELAAHAKAVAQISRTLDQALAAAGQVTMGVEAYGLICGPLFVPMVLAVSAPGLLTLESARRAISSVAQAVDKAATTYRSTEQAHAKALTDLGKGLS